MLINNEVNSRLVTTRVQMLCAMLLLCKLKYLAMLAWIFGMNAQLRPLH